MRDVLTSVGWFFSGLFTRSRRGDEQRLDAVKKEIEDLRAQVEKTRGESKRVLEQCEQLVGASPSAGK
jgi:hypothetical protein